MAYYEEDFERARAVVAKRALTRDSQSHASTHHNDLADMDLQEGKPRAAQARLSQAAEEIIAVGDPDTLIIAALTFGAAIGDLEPLLCAKVYGCAHHASVVEGIPNDEYGEAEDKLVMDRVRALTDGEAFDRASSSARARTSSSWCDRWRRCRSRTNESGGQLIPMVTVRLVPSSSRTVIT